MTAAPAPSPTAVHIAMPLLPTELMAANTKTARCGRPLRFSGPAEKLLEPAIGIEPTTI